MRYVTIPVDDIMYDVLASKAKKAGEPELAYFMRDALRHFCRENAPILPTKSVIRVDQAALDMDLPGVYVARNNSTNPKRYYIGSSQCISKRIRQHVSSLRSGTHHNRLMQEDWAKCDESNFLWGVIDFLPNADDRYLRDREYMWIARFASAFGYEAIYNQRLS